MERERCKKSKSDVDGTNGRVVEVQVGKRWEGTKRERAFSIEEARPFKSRVKEVWQNIEGRKTIRHR